MEQLSLVGRKLELKLYRADEDYHAARDPDYRPANLPTVFGTVIRAILDERDPAWKCYVVRLQEPLSLDKEGIESEYRHVTTSYLLLTTWAVSSYEGRDIIAEELLRDRPFRVLVGPILTELEKLPSQSSIDNVDMWPAVCDGVVCLVNTREK